MMRAALRWLSVMCLSCCSLSALASEDYGMEGEAWNGAGYLTTTAAEADVSLLPTKHLDLSALSEADVLLWLYPADGLELGSLVDFVSQGGHLILADDFGGAGALLEELGVSREPTSRPFPLVKPAEEHFLFFNVDSVRFNHPVTLSGSGTPIGSFGSGALMRELIIGAGRVLIIGDPSVFINDMLVNHHGNKQFAANILRYYCRTEDCAVKLLGPWSSASGRFKARSIWLGTFPRRFEAAVALLNNTLLRLNSAVRDEGLLWAVLAALLAALLALRSLSRQLRFPQGGDEGLSRPALPPLQVSLQAFAATEASADFSRRAKPVFDIPLRWPEACAALSQDGEESSADRESAKAALNRINMTSAKVRADSTWALDASEFVRLVNDARLLIRYLDNQDVSRGR